MQSRYKVEELLSALVQFYWIQHFRFFKFKWTFQCHCWLWNTKNIRIWCHTVKSFPFGASSLWRQVASARKSYKKILYVFKKLTFLGKTFSILKSICDEDKGFRCLYQIQLSKLWRIYGWSCWKDLSQNCTFLTTRRNCCWNILSLTTVGRCSFKSFTVEPTENKQI